MNSKGVYLGVISNIFGNSLMLGATIWLTHILSPEEFGEFRVGANFATIIIPFLAMGGERLISKTIQKNHTSEILVSEITLTILTIASLGALLLAFAYPILSEYIFSGTLSFGVYISSLAIIPLTIAYNIGNTIWRHIGDASKAQTHLNLTQRLIRAPLLIFASLVWPIAFSSSLAMVSAQAISLINIKQAFSKYTFPSIRSALYFARKNIKELLTLGIPIALTASIDRLDVLLINSTIGVKTAGTYDLIFMLSLTAMFPAMAMSKISEPFLYSLRSDKHRLTKVRTLQTKSYALSFLAVIGVAIFSPIISNYLGNSDQNFSKSAIILSSGIAFSSAYGPVLEYMQINGKSRQTMMIVFLLLIIFFLLKYTIASSGSLVGVAALSGLFYLTLRLTLSIYIYK